ncbi:MAG TPA: glycoside hydrolase family 43 protein [Caulifigura sp.]|jgi:GH43 family beta-xylosidase|nr:glycoside hydrolase family 43 protein [Caulifigura sp.]
MWRWRLLLLTCSVLLLFRGAACPAQETTFRNPILPHAADPWVIRHTDGFYYYCSSSREEIALTRSKTLTGLAAGERQIIRPRRPAGPDSRQVWAPELHFLDGAWYVYFAASDGDNANHRMHVLENRSADPFAGTFTEKGRIAAPDDDLWAIDGSVLEHDGKRYFVWSRALGENLDPQVLCIARMTNPWTLENPTVEISRPTHRWERRGDPDVNEGPQALSHAGRTFLVYSASGSWTDDYCLGLLSLKPGGNPLNAANWNKSPEPVFQSANGVFGPGHCCFTKSPDGTEDWILYHAAREKGSGWDRNVRMQRFEWATDGTPQFGEPQSIERSLQKPSGE